MLPHVYLVLPTRCRPRWWCRRLTLTLTLTRLKSLRQYAQELSEGHGQHHHFPHQCSFDAAHSAAPSVSMHLPGSYGGSKPNPTLTLTSP